MPTHANPMPAVSQMDGTEIKRFRELTTGDYLFVIDITNNKRHTIPTWKDEPYIHDPHYHYIEVSCEEAYGLAGFTHRFYINDESMWSVDGQFVLCMSKQVAKLIQNTLDIKCRHQVSLFHEIFNGELKPRTAIPAMGSIPMV